MTEPISRRRFLNRATVAGTGSAVALTSGSIRVAADETSAPTGSSEFGSFHGRHQAGVLETPSRALQLVAFDVIAERADDVADLFATITDRARLVTAGGTPDDAGPSAPPDDNGVLGPELPSGRSTITLGVGASLFDDRYGLAAKAPRGLRPMRTFPNDDLDPAQCHGDLIVQVRADDTDAAIHAVRDLTKHTRGGMQPRWAVTGFAGPPRPDGAPRNLMGFKDGSANPDASDRAEMRRLVWAGDGEPAWAVGGTYQVVRIIRMLVEFWDRVSLTEQERMIGRRRDTGAPLTGDLESDTPSYEDDPYGKVITADAHIRLANPRTKDTADSRILRRGWNFQRGLDANGQLDQGLVFTCYQQDIARQFEATQERLIDEPLVDYISPVGGGYFFVLPGVRDRNDRFGKALFA